MDETGEFENVEPVEPVVVGLEFCAKSTGVGELEGTAVDELVELAGAKLVEMGRDDAIAVAKDEPGAVTVGLAAEDAKVTPTSAHCCCPQARNCSKSA